MARTMSGRPRLMEDSDGAVQMALLSAECVSPGKPGRSETCHTGDGRQSPLVDGPAPVGGVLFWALMFKKY